MNNPVIAIVGLDPAKHEVPTLLTHHLKKMQKDFPIAFIDTDTPTPEIVDSLKNMIKKACFKPIAKKSKIIT